MATSVLVNGVNLNTLGFQVDVLKGRRSVPIRKGFGIEVPGLHGITNSVGPFDTQFIGFELWVDDADPTTGAPSDGWTTFEKNLSLVASAFVRPDGLASLTVTDTDLKQKVYTGRLAAYVVDDAARRISGSIEVPGVWGRSPSALVHTSSTFGSIVNLTALETAKSCAPISDAVYTVTGPAVSPSITCAVSNQTVTLLSVSLAAGDKWILDTGLRTSVKVLSGGGTASVMSSTKFVSSQLGAPILEIWPTNTDLANPNRYRVNVAATSTTGASSWSVSAKAAYY